jgi:cytochrome c-type biogenesis protein CcmH
MIFLVLMLALPSQSPPSDGIAYAPIREGLSPLDAAREARVMALGKKLRCAVCQGESIVDSPASMARAQLDKVRELVAEGKSDDDILNFFSSRYGEFVLLEPRREGLNWVLWLGPGAIVLGGMLLLFFQTRKQPAVVVEAVPPARAKSTTSDDTSPEGLLAQVRADMDKQ